MVKRGVKGAMIMVLAVLMPLVIVMLVVISLANGGSQDPVLTSISWILLLLPVALVGFVVIMYFRTRTWMGCTVTEIDRNSGTCTVRTSTLDRSERQRGIKMARTYPLGYANGFRVMPSSELSGPVAFLLKWMSKGMYHLVLYAGPQVLQNFIFSDFTPESLQGIKNTIEEFLALR